MTGGDTAVPFARAVVNCELVIVQRRKLDGHMETDRLHVPVKTAPSSDRMRARQRYRAFSHYVAAAFIGPFFPPDPLPEVHSRPKTQDRTCFALHALLRFHRPRPKLLRLPPTILCSLAGHTAQCSVLTQALTQAKVAVSGTARARLARTRSLSTFVLIFKFTVTNNHRSSLIL